MLFAVVAAIGMVVNGAFALGQQELLARGPCEFALDVVRPEQLQACQWVRITGAALPLNVAGKHCDLEPRGRFKTVESRLCDRFFPMLSHAAALECGAFFQQEHPPAACQAYQVVAWMPALHPDVVGDGAVGIRSGVLEGMVADGSTTFVRDGLAQVSMRTGATTRALVMVELDRKPQPAQFIWPRMVTAVLVALAGLAYLLRGLRGTRPEDTRPPTQLL